jgi:hypothetical protein
MHQSPELEEILDDFVSAADISATDRESLKREYLAFLASASGNREIRPKKLIDELWHKHILDTRAYARDCENWFGNFIHHRPCRHEEAVIAIDSTVMLANCGASGPGLNN